MSYRVGVDLGTTYCSAAAAGDGRAETVPLGNRAAVVPSVVFVAEDGTWLTGEAAEGRSLTQSSRVAREFKRRVGDPRPIAVGGVERTAAELMALQLRPILDTVAARRGGPPERIALTHPANWGAARREALLAAIQPEGLPDIVTVTEPEAAAIHYAATERIEPSQVVAVYDLGGGTFDAALLRRTEVGEVGAGRGFEVIGRPEGIDRLGGVDFDAAVLAHVNRFLDGALDTLDVSDPAAAAGLQRLRADCVEAKEALSSETDTAIPVLLPRLRTEVRMTRAEFEGMIRPALMETVGALRRALRAAEVAPADVAAVLLVGGSSRIPLVAQLVGAELRRPVAVDAHPKHAVALGAALAAAAVDREVAPPRSAAGPAGAVSGSTVAAAAAPAGPSGSAAPPSATPAAAPPAPPRPAPTPADAGPPAGRAPAGAADRAGGDGHPEGGDEPPGAAGEPGDRRPVGEVPAARRRPAGGDGGPSAETDRGRSAAAEPRPGADAGGGRRRVAFLAALGVLVAAIVAVFVALSGSGGDDPDPQARAGNVEAAAGTPGPSSTTAPTVPTTPSSVATTATSAAAGTVASIPATPPAQLPADCETSTRPFVCITAVGVDAAQNLVIPFVAMGFDPFIGPAPNRHIHFFFPVGTMANDPSNAGSGGPSPGDWVLWDQPNPFGPGGEQVPYQVADAREVDATRICVLVADNEHVVEVGTGNCLPLPDAVIG